MDKNPVIFKRSDDRKWIAYLKNNPEIRAMAKKKAEAVGLLYMLNNDRLHFVVGYEDHEDEVVEIRQLYVEQNNDKEAEEPSSGP